MTKANIVTTLMQCVVLCRKTCWLILIDRLLDRYIKVSYRNKRLFYKIDSIIYRYNHIFGENLGYDNPEMLEVSDNGK